MAASTNGVPAFSPILNPQYAHTTNLPSPFVIKPKTTLIKQGQKPRFVGLVRSGIVKLTYTNDQGNESILGLRSEGWWLNASLALLDVPSLTNVVTVTECSVSRMSIPDFSERLLANPEEQFQFLLAQCRQLLSLQQHSIMLGSRAGERLAFLLGENSQAIWKTVDPTRLLLQRDIAELLSITPEHLSRLQHGERGRPATPTSTRPSARTARR